MNSLAMNSYALAGARLYSVHSSTHLFCYNTPPLAEGCLCARPHAHREADGGGAALVLLPPSRAGSSPPPRSIPSLTGSCCDQLSSSENQTFESKVFAQETQLGLRYEEKYLLWGMIKENIMMHHRIFSMVS